MIRQFFRLTGQKRATTTMLVGHMIAGVLQGVALGLLIPFLSAFLAGEDALPWLLAVCAVAAVSLAFAVWASFRSMAIACLDVCGTLISRVVGRVQRLPLGWFHSASAGTVSKATSRDVSFLSHMPSIALPFISSACGTLVGVFAVTVFVDWRIAVAMILPVPVAVWALVLMRRAVVREHRAHALELAKLSQRILEFTRLQPILRANDQCRQGWEPLDSALDSELETMLIAGKAKGPAGSLFHSAVAVGMLGSVGLGMYFLFAGEVSAPVFLALALMAVRFAEPIGMLAFYIDALHEAQVAMDSIETITCADLLDVPSEDTARQASEPYDIVFDHVSFAYDERRPVLQDVSFTIPSGSVTAIVGPSGTGKSTLSRLVARFWDVDSGRITIGGVDVRDMSEKHLMSLISMVFQDVYLFDTSIVENVHIGRAEASEAEVRLACQRAALDEVIALLPQGLDTRVGEGGTALSGGERQRVALARAFVKDAPILLLDEVTSALDGMNEARVTQALHELAQGRTVMVIAHRLSTIRSADQIVVLNAGGVEAIGTHNDLYEGCATYREFWDDQQAVARWKI